MLQILTKYMGYLYEFGENLKTQEFMLYHKTRVDVISVVKN